METILIILGTAVLVLTMLYLLAPVKIEILRANIIDKSLSDSFLFTKSLKNQNFWSPWGNDIDDKSFVHTGKDGVVGFKTAWSKKYRFFEIEAEQEITKIIENRTVETIIRYTKPIKVTAVAFLNVYEEGNKTKIIWVFKIKMKRPHNVIAFFIGLDKIVGRGFDIALNKIRHYVEADVEDENFRSHM